MTDYLTQGFGAQLTTAMEAVLRKALFEVMTIFENSLHDHQMALVQKGEEVTRLKTQLQKAEIKLRELQCESGRGIEMTKTQSNVTQQGPEVVPNPSGQTSEVPEIDFEVPDDWCAPLGCETTTKQDGGLCPSIKLRPLLIPLWRIPVIKKEEDNCDIDSHQQIEDLGRSRDSSLNNGHKHTQDKIFQNRGSRRKSLRNDMKKLLQDIRPENPTQTSVRGLRRRGIHLTGKEQEDTVNGQREESKITAAEHRKKQERVENISGKKYTCKFCKKVFETVFGRSVHVRSHKRCRGCKKEFPFPSVLKCHKPSCEKLQKLLTKELRINPAAPQSKGEEQPALPSKKQVCIDKECSRSCFNHSESMILRGDSAIQRDKSTKDYSCALCNKEFGLRCKLKEHLRIHTGEKPFSCSMCPKKFRVNQSLKYHKTRIHSNHNNSKEQNGDLAWTEPLEDTEDNREDLISPSKDSRCTIKGNGVKEERDPGVKLSYKRQSKGMRNTKGFICLLCQKFARTKHALIEHFRLHTGERPIKCENCPANFRTSQQLYIHKKMCRHPVTVSQCEKCQKKFSSKLRYNKHVSKCLKHWPNACKVCGKGFITEGRLRNHMDRCHS